MPHGLPTTAPPGDVVSGIENPLFVPLVDCDFLWNQIVDTIDDYFRIQREVRVRQIGNVLTDGRIDTHTEVGATLLEPWRNDSTRGFERLHSTLQSIRRQAVVHIRPDQAGYLIDVIVTKELESLRRPERSEVGHSILRYDNSLTSEFDEPVRGSDEAGLNGGWIPLGRDVQLEQRILEELRGRLYDSHATSSGV